MNNPLKNRWAVTNTSHGRLGDTRTSKALREADIHALIRFALAVAMGLGWLTPEQGAETQEMFGGLIESAEAFSATILALWGRAAMMTRYLRLAVDGR